mgnify:CR=1 FL=1
MVGIERIKQRILEEAHEEKRTILEDAKSRAQDIAAKSDQKAEEIKQAMLERYKRIGEEEKRKILSISQLELRKALLTEKQSMISDVFEKAEEKLKDLSVQEYQKLISNMLMEAAITGDEEIIIAESDRDKITPSLVSMVNQTLQAAGKNGNLKLSDKSRNMIGGFVLRSKDLEVNNTFDSLVKQEREELETKIAKILFGE